MIYVFSAPYMLALVYSSHLIMLYYTVIHFMN